MLRFVHVKCASLVVGLIVLQSPLLLKSHSSFTAGSVGNAILDTNLPARAEVPSDPVHVDESMTFVTLTYGPMSAMHSNDILHNCLMIKRAKGENSFIVFTDKPELREYCKHCECKKFRMYECRCPIPSGNCTGVKNGCEKNHFFSDMMLNYPEVVYLDHDLLIMKPSFFEALYPRSRHHDFLAARDQLP